MTSLEEEMDIVCGTACLDQSKQANLTPILPPGQKAKRTILLFGVDEKFNKKMWKKNKR